MKDGFGRMEYSNGEVYEGMWKENLKDTKGKFFMEVGNYIGDFKEN